MDSYVARHHCAKCGQAYIPCESSTGPIRLNPTLLASGQYAWWNTPGTRGIKRHAQPLLEPGPGYALHECGAAIGQQMRLDGAA